MGLPLSPNFVIGWFAALVALGSLWVASHMWHPPIAKQSTATGMTFTTEFDRFGFGGGAVWCNAPRPPAKPVRVVGPAPWPIPGEFRPRRDLVLFEFGDRVTESFGARVGPPHAGWVPSSYTTVPAVRIPIWRLGVLVVLLPVPLLVRRHLAERTRFRRLRNGQCPACAYDLSGNLSNTCPECGASVPPRPRPGMCPAIPLAARIPPRKRA
jgi:hypothetical protein